MSLLPNVNALEGGGTALRDRFSKGETRYDRNYLPGIQRKRSTE